MIRFLLSLLLVLTAFGAVSAQNRTFTAQQYAKKVDDSSLIEKFKDFQIFQLNTADLEDYVRQTNGDTEFSLKIGEKFNWNIDVMNGGIYADNYLLRDGEKTYTNNRPVPMRGYLAGGNNERVALTVGENFIYGTIEENGKVYYIEPLRYFTANQSDDLFVIYEEGDAIKDNTIKCAVTEKHSREKALKQSQEATEKSMMMCREVGLAIASDVMMFQSYGSIAAVEAHNVAVMNTVNMDYDINFDDELRFEIVEQFVATTVAQEPLSGTTVIDDILDEFAAWAPTGFVNEHDLGQHWSSRDYDGTTIGLAYSGPNGVSCGAFGYHVLQDFSNAQWALRVLTSHEIGHNLTLDHDASTSPTIMAPSVTNTDIWSAASIAGINAHVPTVSCFSACPPDMPPSIAFTSDYTQICTGGLTRFVDNSTENPTSWSWTFAGGTPASSSQQNPIIRYNTPGTYAVTLTAMNGVGGNSSTQNGYITVGNTGSELFYYEDFEAGLNGWTIENPDNSVTWSAATIEGARFGTQAMFVDNFDYGFVGERDGLISPTIDFSGRADATLNIEYAYTNYDTNNRDSLIVLLSIDDGANYFRVLTLGEDGNGTLATRPATTSEFTPSISSDWCSDGIFGNGCLAIDLSGYTSSTVRVKIENFNDFGNNMYIENVGVASSCQMFVAPTALFSVQETQGCPTFETQYFDNSEGSPTAWSWDFPGGTPATSTSQNPMVSYDTPGTYTATLTVTNEAGSDTETQTNIVTIIQETTPDFTFVVNGMSVDFTDNSQNANSYSWFFGDTETSGDINPSHTYANEGVYPVTLTVTNECGSNPITQEITIEAMPVAAFLSNVTSGCTPLTVDFTNMSSGLNGVPNWEFEGGTPATSSDNNPTIIYNTPGTYTVTLTVTNSAGMDTEMQENIIVVNTEPVGSFAAVTDELTVDFTTDATPTPTTVEWNFGDENTSTELNPTHTYAAEGTYLVTVTASNECGEITDMIEVTAMLTPTAPIAGFTASVTEGCEPFTVQFNDQSSANTENYNWTFEGGTPASSTDANPIVIYNTPGTFSVSLIVSNGVGDNTFEENNYIIVNPLPTTSFTPVANELAVDFTNTSTEATTYEWDFGDAEMSTEVNPTHTYAAEGTYNVTLIATNNCGSITEVMEITVTLTPVAPTAAFTANVTQGCEPLTVQFTNQSSANTETINWTFPGGTPATSTDQNPLVIYNTPGTFDVILIATNGVGDAEEMQSGYIIVDPLPIADFTAVNNDLSVDFMNGSQDGDNFTWDFGDAMISSETDPTHLYENEGTYLVTLIVTNDCGMDTFTEEVTVSLLPVAPTAAFSASATMGCAPFSVQYTNQSSLNAESLFWEFTGGNPATSTEENPTVVYTNAGVFSATLTVTNGAGMNVASETNFLTINVLPTVNFSESATALTVDFTNLTDNGDTYEWNFGDDETSILENPSHTYDAEGTYDVILSATNECGTIEETIQVTVSLGQTAPTAAFSASANEGCAPLSVVINNLSSSNADDYMWEVSGPISAMSTEENPTFVLSIAGTYSITLTVSNEVGEDTETQMNFIVSDVPTANFNSSISGTTANFLNSSQDADTYLWNFGDSEMSNEENPVHIYDNEGFYTVTLTVTNECGDATWTQGVTVGGMLPTAFFFADIEEDCVPLVVQFTDNSGGNPTNWNWSFAGGTPAVSNEQNPVVTFETPGEFDVTLAAFNETGSNSLLRSEYIVALDLPTAFFTWEKTGLVLSFTNNTTAGGQTYLWDFGDGTTAESASPSHIYDGIGTYNVSLIVTNECGSTTYNETITLATTGIGELDFLSEFNLFPNPNDGQFTLILNGESLGSEDMTIRFINIVGQVLDSETVNFTGNLQRTYDHRDLPAGMYFVELKAGEKQVYRKVVIE